MRKTPTNLSIREDLVQRSRELGINLSELLERELETAIIDAERAEWLAANSDAIADYNANVEKRGVFSEEWRRF